MMQYQPGFDIRPSYNPLGFTYGKGVFGPEPENRTLEAIRQTLLDPCCQGPEIVYSIAMDVGCRTDQAAIRSRNLLYGAVTYAKGRLGKEPVRSQGHIHAISPSCGMSTCEVYEIWNGSAFIYMQETAEDDPGRCYAVLARPGDTVIVPPGWAHCTVTADLSQNLTFGAWCVRDYGFEYGDVRRHGGLAWYPVIEREETVFIKNSRYHTAECTVKRPRIYTEFQLEHGKPIYTQFQENPDKFLFVSKPQTAASVWKNFIP